ncbi:hypothetical protein F4778DRAFT_784359 [Xylariomycetidae sp. FL2044]|nr:hypothetical protein F4778DRAFT_784359 [Xylariomycetidae sp. FL2044]
MQFSTLLLPLSGFILANGLAIQSADIESRATDIEARSDCVAPGLAPSLWVDVPAQCATCIIQCMATTTGSQWVAGTTITSVSLWRNIGTCGVTCSLGDDAPCTSRQAGTWQARQPNNMPSHQKRAPRDPSEFKQEA